MLRAALLVGCAAWTLSCSGPPPMTPSTTDDISGAEAPSGSAEAPSANASAAPSTSAAASATAGPSVEPTPTQTPRAKVTKAEVVAKDQYYKRATLSFDNPGPYMCTIAGYTLT